MNVQIASPAKSSWMAILRGYSGVLLPPLLLIAAAFCLALCIYWIVAGWDRWGAVSWLVDDEHANWARQKHNSARDGMLLTRDSLDRPVDFRPWKTVMLSMLLIAEAALLSILLLRWRKLLLAVIVPLLLVVIVWACAYRFAPFVIFKEGTVAVSKDDHYVIRNRYGIGHVGQGWSGVKWYDWVFREEYQTEGGIGLIVFSVLGGALAAAAVSCKLRSKPPAVDSCRRLPGEGGQSENWNWDVDSSA